jgi:hypothetical protein
LRRVSARRIAQPIGNVRSLYNWSVVGHAKPGAARSE